MEFIDWRFRSLRFGTDSLYTSPPSDPMSVRWEEMTDGELEWRLEDGKLAEAGDSTGEVGVADVCCAMFASVLCP